MPNRTRSRKKSVKKSRKKSDNRGKIRNPKTGRYVKKSGIIGKKLLAKSRKKKSKKRRVKSTKKRRSRRLGRAPAYYAPGGNQPCVFRNELDCERLNDVPGNRLCVNIDRTCFPRKMYGKNIPNERVVESYKNKYKQYNIPCIKRARKNCEKFNSSYGGIRCRLSGPTSEYLAWDKYKVCVPEENHNVSFDYRNQYKREHNRGGNKRRRHPFDTGPKIAQRAGVGPPGTPLRTLYDSLLPQMEKRELDRYLDRAATTNIFAFVDE